MISVTEDNFESVVRQSKLPVLGEELFWVGTFAKKRIEKLFRKKCGVGPLPPLVHTP